MSGRNCARIREGNLGLRLGEGVCILSVFLLSLTSIECLPSGFHPCPIV
jgi:hypothetical protein